MKRIISLLLCVVLFFTVPLIQPGSEGDQPNCDDDFLWIVV